MEATVSRGIAVLALSALGLAACGGTTGGNAGAGEGSGGAGAAPAASAGAGGPASGRAPIVGAILMQQDQFFRMNEDGMREAAKSLGVDLKVQNAGGALDKEATIVDTFLAQKVDALLISPLGSQGSVPALARAHERGVKIVTYNNGLGADFPVCNIESDQESLGASTGQAARAYIEGTLGGKARVALIGFASQLPEQGGARQRGFKKALEGMPGVTIVAEQDAWNAPEAATTVGALLTKRPDLVWAANEGGTVGAVTAVKSAGLAGKVAVFGTDISAQLVDLLLAEDGILKAVTAQKPRDMGRAAVESAVHALRGEPVEKKVVLPGILFTREKPDELRALKQSLDQEAK